MFDTRPKYSPDGKQLAFTRGTQSIRNIYVTYVEVADVEVADIKVNGVVATTQNSNKKTRRLTKGQGLITNFNWLNDTKHLIFDSNERGDKNLWLFNIENNQQELLGAKDAQYPSLNISNSLLAFQEIRYNANIWSIYLTDSNNLPDRIIQSIKYNNFPVFSPDGKKIAFASNRQGKSAIWLYSTKTMKQTKLLAIPQLDLINPNWSNDGRQLLISSRGPEGYRCYQFNIQNSEYKIISVIKPAHYGCIYSGKGDVFAISKEPSEISRLLKLDSAGKVKTLTKLGVSRVQVTNFNKLIYSLADGDGLYSMNFEGQEKKTVLENFSHKLDGHWTVQGNYLYYPKLHEKTHEKHGIWRHDLKTGEEKMVTKALPSAIGLTMSVNPAHTQLILSRTDSRISDIYLADLNF